MMALMTDFTDPAISRLYRVILESLRSGNSDAPLACETLLSLADEHINTVPFHQVQPVWLRLYTDVSLLWALHDRIFSHDIAKVIRRLDMAIIVAGAVGEGRMDWIQRTLRMVRQPVILRDDIMPREVDASHCISPFARSRIPVIQPPSMSRYIQQDRHCPFLLRRYLTSWPAVDHWRSASYLLDLVGEHRVVPVEVGKSYDDADWGQRIVPFREFLARAGYKVQGDRAMDPLYLAQHPLLRQFPELERDIIMPDYVWSSPPTSEEPPYEAPNNVEGVLINVWVGSGGGEIVSPAHTDPYHNCYAQVVGRKRVWVAPPAAGPHMYAYSGEASLAERYMTNTSSVPIFRATENMADVQRRFPAFFEHVQGMEAVLEPGDLLVLPPGWWHAMRGEGYGPAWSVSMWY